MEEEVESPNLETRKMLVKLMPRQLKTALLKDFTPPPNFFYSLSMLSLVTVSSVPGQVKSTMQFFTQGEKSVFSLK